MGIGGPGPASPTSAAPPTVPLKPSLSSLAQRAHLVQPFSAPRPPSERDSKADSVVSQSDANEPKKPKSKLSALASSRASMLSRTSSSYTETADSGSVVTYPPLRPSSDSVISLTSEESTGTGLSSMSSHVRRAIQTALDLEAIELPPSPLPGPTVAVSKTLPGPPVTSQRSHAPTSPPAISTPTPPASSAIDVASSTRRPGAESRPMSKLAQLAQAKAQQGQQSSLSLKPKQVKSEAVGFGITVPKSHTEYLTPIVNGPTATTAITTTYQTLGSLAQSKHSSKVLSQDIGMFASKSSRAGGELKQSKLAMKSQRISKQIESDTEPEPILAVLDHPMFTLQSARSRALPSTFASLLIDDDELSVDRQRGSASRAKESARTQEHRTLIDKSRRRTRKRHDVPPAPPSTGSSRGFAFDVPSPDDIVFNARRGTSLAPRSLPTSTHHPPSTSSGPAPGSSSTASLPSRTSVQQS